MFYRKSFVLSVCAVFGLCLAQAAMASHGGSSGAKSGGSLFGSQLSWTAHPEDVDINFTNSTVVSPGVDITINSKMNRTSQCSLDDGNGNVENFDCRLVNVKSTGFKKGSCTKESGGVDASYFPYSQKCGVGDTTGTIEEFGGARVWALGSTAGLNPGGCGKVFPADSPYAKGEMGITSLYISGNKTCDTSTTTPQDGPILQRVCGNAEEKGGTPTDCFDLNGKLTAATGTSDAISFINFLTDANPNSINTSCHNEGGIWVFAFNQTDINFTTFRVEGIAGEPGYEGVAPNVVNGLPQCEVGDFDGDGSADDSRCRIPTCGSPNLGELLRAKDTDLDNMVSVFVSFRTNGTSLRGGGTAGVGSYGGHFDATLTPTQ